MGNRNLKGEGLTSSSSNRQPVRKQLMESASFSDSKSTESSSMDNIGAFNPASFPSSSRAAQVSPEQLYHCSLFVFFFLVYMLLNIWCSAKCFHCYYISSFSQLYTNLKGKVIYVKPFNYCRVTNRLMRTFFAIN